MNNKTQKKNLKSRDLIAIGIFNAILFVIFLICGGVLGMNPLTYPFYPTAFGLLAGAVFMILSAKVPKRGMRLITGVFPSVLFLLVSANPSFLIPCIIAGFISEIIFAKTSGIKGIIASYTVYCLSLYAGSFIPIVFFTDTFIEYSLGQGMTVEYMQTAVDLFKGPVGLIAMLTCVVGAMLGGMFGAMLFKKHFKKAGVV